jgi:hypothetical protein
MPTGRSMKKIKTVSFLIILIMFCSPLTYASMPSISVPEMEIIDNDIIVSFSVDSAPELESKIRSGIEKEITFTVELLRAWRFWPDEFVVSKKIRRTIRYDNLRDQYLAVSDDGIKKVERHFKEFGELRDWLFSISAVNLANIRELEPGDYYIRTVVESRSIEHIPLIGLLMLFIPEVEMSMAKESSHFILEPDE